MGVASLRRGTIANASQLPLPKVVKRYCAPLNGAISSTMPFCLAFEELSRLLWSSWSGASDSALMLTLCLTNARIIIIIKYARIQACLCLFPEKNVKLKNHATVSRWKIISRQRVRAPGSAPYVAGSMVTPLSMSVYSCDVTRWLYDSSVVRLHTIRPFYYHSTTYVTTTQRIK